MLMVLCCAATAYAQEQPMPLGREQLMAQPTIPGMNVGQPQMQPYLIAPLQFKDQKNKTISLKDVEGKLTAVHFWAMWCAPCLKELPELNVTAGKYAKQGFRVVAISLDTTPMKKLVGFLKEHKFTNLTPYLDHKMQSFKAAAAMSLPATFLVNRKGEVVYRKEGRVAWASEEIETLIENELTKTAEVKP